MALIRIYFQLMVGICMMLGAVLPAAMAEPTLLFIDPVEAKKIYRVHVPFQEEIVLTTEDLPAQHPEHEAIYFAEQKFSHLAVAPGGKRLAFSVDAVPHDWAGILDMNTKEIQEMDFFLEGKSLKPFWSGGGRFLVVEGQGPMERKFLKVFDTQVDQVCLVEGKRLRQKFLNFSKAWFSQDGETLFFRVDYNNAYRKKLGLKSKKINPKIGQINLQCQGFQSYSVKEFMKKFPEQLPGDASEMVSLEAEKISSLGVVR